MTQQGWSERLAASVAAEVRRHRTRLGMSAQQLADECKKLGVPIQRSVIANFENGRRTNVAVSDLLVFAAALKVSPMQLVFPVGYERSIEGLPGLTRDVYSWAGWFSGEIRSQSDWPFAPDDLNAMELVRSIVPLVSDLTEGKKKLAVVSEAFEEVKEELQLAEAEVEAASSELERLITQRESNLEKRNAMDDLLSPEYRKLADEGDQLRELSAQARARLIEARERMSSLLGRRRAVELWQLEVAEDEKAIREIIREFEERGFVIPEFPEELAYLLEPEPTADEAPQLRRKRTRSEARPGSE
jgi:transcriptional regulator with XRE-family HTH domain